LLVPNMMPQPCRPFICGEWTYGGIPTWVNGLEKVQIRSHNPSWEQAMSAFVKQIWTIVEPYTARSSFLSGTPPQKPPPVHHNALHCTMFGIEQHDVRH
jgi:hypothetical protein